MSNHPWNEVENLLNQALARPAEEREAFLREACGDDAALRGELESLLVHAEADSRLLAEPVFTSAEFGHGESLVGRRIGPYAVQSLLGTGGMGEVYRARDVRLGREVAIKILPDAFSREPHRRVRFDREARLLAALNHQHIAAIYGVENGDSIPALVLEFVEGDTLAERIARGPLAIEEALRVALQIAEALDAAHDKGIVHRDLKPANIKITPDGIVKVLDFGLAKATIDGDADVNLSRSPTVTRGGTGDGIILGTAPYMSPEQARGRPTDKRTDVWAFGCVLYEMLTGRAAFSGETLSDTIVSILEREPDWSALPPATPGSVRRLLRRCLDRDVKRRLRDIGDARIDLDDGVSDRTAHGPTTTSVASMSQDSARAAPLARWDRALILFGAVALVIAVAAYAFAPRKTIPERVRRNEITPPQGYSFAPLMEGGPVALSPDGRQVAFVASGPKGRSLWVRSVDAFDARELTGTEDAAAPFWSPNSDAVAFVADGKLKTVGLAGGVPQELATGLTFTSQGAMPGNWNSDGMLAYYRSTMWVVSSQGGESRPLTTRNAVALDENHYGLVFLPDGRHFLMLVRGGVELRLEIVVGEVGSSARITLLRDVTSAQYAPGRNGRPSHVLFVRDGKLMARPFDEKTLQLTGSEAMLAQDVAVSLGGGLADFSVSTSGVVAYRLAASGPQKEMAWYDRSGTVVGALGDRRGNPRNNIRISPTGKRVAFTRQGATTPEVWIGDVATGYIQRLTANGRSPVWSADESEIAFIRQDDDINHDQPMYSIYRRKIDSGNDVKVWSRAGLLAINDWSRDGRSLLLTIAAPPESESRIEGWLLPDISIPAATRTPVKLETRTGHSQFVPSAQAPHWITSDGLFVEALPGTKPGQWQVGERATPPHWSRDGKELFFHENGFVWVVGRGDSTTDFQLRGQPRQLFRWPPGFQVASGQWAPGWDVTPDGQRFLVTNPPPDTPSSIAVITNWDLE